MKREFIGGELREIKKVVLPVGAAILGMLFPAAIYLSFNIGTPVAHGWGIPMATDIAFALAIVYLLGDKVPLSAKVFLTTLAIVDDLGSVIVIALFYTSNISIPSILVGLTFSWYHVHWQQDGHQTCLFLWYPWRVRCMGSLPHVRRSCYNSSCSCRICNPR